MKKELKYYLGGLALLAGGFAGLMSKNKFISVGRGLFGFKIGSSLSTFVAYQNFRQVVRSFKSTVISVISVIQKMLFRRMILVGLSGKCLMEISNE